ncbi:MAG TPA: zinc ribbon domain-containing protein [Polyangia bacterium]|nr:zinc ribbon domain-containing protein [Polyangia bacterium]
MWAIALLGAVVATAYAGLIEKMRFGPPLVMFGLGGMTLALSAAALYRVIDPLAHERGAAVAPRTGRHLKELEREKQLVLKAIKEIELDYQMRKIADRDYREMVERYRTRAMRLISEIEAGDDYRALIERELALRLKVQAADPAAGTPVAAPVPAAAGAPAPVAKSEPARRVCGACSTGNDPDAQFCKSCGQRL